MSIEMFLMVLLTTVLISCEQQKDPCVAPKVEQNIVGKWSGNWQSSELSCGLEFKADNSYLEDNDLLLGSYFSPAAKWEVKKDSVYVTVKYSNSTTTIYNFKVKKNDCNEIILDLEGLEEMHLVRK
jgi:hypothetical protein